MVPLRKPFFVLAPLVMVAALFAVWQIYGSPKSYRSTQQSDISDYRRLVDLTDFEFKTFVNVCRDAYPFLLILVTTDPNNFERRKTIRDTWGSNTNEIKTAFLLGAVHTNGSVQELEIEEKLILEHEQHGDLLQGNFVDSYRNLSYKHVMALKYVTYHCPKVSYVLKVDDDAFININRLVDVIRKQLGAENVMFCKAAKAWPVPRAPISERSVSFDDYPGEMFPPYCWGFAIVYSPDVMAKLYRTAQKTKYLWIEDVYVTGILAVENGLKHKTASKHVFGKKELPKIMKSTKLNPKFLFGYDLSDEVVRELWERA